MRRRLVRTLITATLLGVVAALGFSPGELISETELNRATSHVGFVWDLAFSRDGVLLASGGADGVIKVWDRHNMIHFKDLRGHAGAISKLAWLSNPDRIVSTGFDQTLRIWDIAQSTYQLASNSVTGRVLAVDPAQKLLAAETSTHPGATIEIRSAEPPYGFIRRVYSGLNAEIQGLTFSSDGRKLAALSADGVVVIDVESGRAVSQWKWPDAYKHVYFTRDASSVLLIRDFPAEVRLWALSRAGPPELKATKPLVGACLAADLSSVGDLLLHCSSVGLVHALAAEGKQFTTKPRDRLVSSSSPNLFCLRIPSLELKWEGAFIGDLQPWAIAIDPRGGEFAIATRLGTIETHPMSLPPPTTKQFGADMPATLLWPLADGRSLIAANANHENFELWIGDGHDFSRRSASYPYTVQAIHPVPRGKLLVVVSGRNRIDVLDVPSCTIRYSTTEPEGDNRLARLAVDPKGQWLAVCYGSLVVVRSVSSLQTIQRHRLPRELFASDVSIDSDGSLVVIAYEPARTKRASSREGAVITWANPLHLDDPKIDNFQSGAPIMMARDGDNAVVATNHGELRYSDISGQWPSEPSPGRGSTRSLTFLPDGRLAVGKTDNRVVIVAPQGVLRQLGMTFRLKRPAYITGSQIRVLPQSFVEQLRGRFRMVTATTDGRVFLFTFNTWGIRTWVVCLGSPVAFLPLLWPRSRRRRRPDIHNSTAISAPLADRASPEQKDKEPVPAMNQQRHYEDAFAIVIGIGGDLPETIRDAEGISAHFVDKDRCAFRRENVQLLTGPSADRPGILTALGQLSALADRPETTAIVYYSGHGGTVEREQRDRFFLAPNGFAEDAIAATGIWDEEFAEALGGIRAGKLVVLLDCCHAGGLAHVKDSRAIKPGPPDDFLKRLVLGTGRVVISSSRRDQLSYGGYPYSLFTAALLEGFAGYGSLNEDGFVKLGDLVRWLGEEVPRRSERNQMPVLDASRTDLDFPLSYYAGGSRLRKNLAWTWSLSPSSLPQMRGPDMANAATRPQLAPTEIDRLLMNVEEESLDRIYFLMIIPRDSRPSRRETAAEQKGALLRYVGTDPARRKALSDALRIVLARDEPE